MHKSKQNYKYICCKTFKIQVTTKGHTNIFRTWLKRFVLFGNRKSEGRYLST